MDDADGGEQRVIALVAAVAVCSDGDAGGGYSFVNEKLTEFAVDPKGRTMEMGIADCVRRTMSEPGR